MMKRFTRVVLCIVLCVASADAAQQQFRLLDTARTHVSFVGKRVPDVLDSAVIDIMFSGGAVAIGDLDGDGWEDLILGAFSGVEVYRNLGGLTFQRHAWNVQDVDTRYATGISLSDVDRDGDLDVYVCRWYLANRLFVNDGHGSFTDVAASYGVDVASESTMAVFFDADEDGWMDLYLAQYTVVDTSARARALPLRNTGLSNMPVSSRHVGLQDRFFRNDQGRRFIDRTHESGIKDQAHGLNVVIADVNDDGHQDIYVANDFNARDELYLGSGSGTFKPAHRAIVNKSSVYSMGIDIADLDNDGRMEIMTTDMLSRDHFRRIVNTGINGDASIYNPMYDSGQVMRNVLLWNRGDGTFADIGFMAGVEATDWSWACLMQDFDLDGWKDIVVVNGFLADIINQDMVYSLDRKRDLDPYKNKRPLLEPNFAFRNKGDLTFEDVSSAWGVDHVSNSVGAAAADLDHDGDLDLVVNNVDSISFLYENTSVAARWISVELVGPAHNRFAQGARVYCHVGTQAQMIEVSASRGFFSSVVAPVSFGLGDATAIDSIVVEWSPTERSVVVQPAAQRRLVVTHASVRSFARTPRSDTALYFQRTAVSFDPPFRQEERTFDDFKRIRLLPLRLTWDGPTMSIGDLDNDGLYDVFFGGSAGIMPRLYKQTPDGAFQIVPSGGFGHGVAAEDVASTLIDIDGDADLDIVVGAGGLEAEHDTTASGVRVYRNDGRGSFTVITSIPSLPIRVGALATDDVDNDGDIDIMVCGRVDVERYPYAPRSALLINDGHGVFTDATDDRTEGFSRHGMISAALFVDLNGDATKELVTAGEWTGLTVFENVDGRLRRSEAYPELAAATGFWNGLDAGDIDHDGDVDLIAGNLGWNNRYHRYSTKEPIVCYAYDFDENGSIDPLVTYVPDSARRLIKDRVTIYEHMPTLNRQFTTYSAFARAPFDSMFDHALLDKALVLKATTFSSSVFRNDGRQGFHRHSLPSAAQVSPMMGTALLDLNGDSFLDLVYIGNHYGADPEFVRYDAGRGGVLLGSDSCVFTPVDGQVSGFHMIGDMRSLALLPHAVNGATEIIALVGCNQAPLAAFKLVAPGTFSVVPNSSGASSEHGYRSSSPRVERRAP